MAALTVEFRGQSYERHRRSWRDPGTHIQAPSAVCYQLDAMVSRDEQLRLQARAQDFADLMEIHRRELERKGWEYRGATLEITHRHTHCWQCRTSLDSGIELSCIACGWIICWCGACGCGYRYYRIGQA